MAAAWSLRLACCVGLCAAAGCGSAPSPKKTAPRPARASAQPPAKSPASRAPQSAARTARPEPQDTDSAFRQLAVRLYQRLQALSKEDEKPRIAVYYFLAPPRRRNAVGEYVASMLPCFLSEAAGGRILIFTRRYLDQLLSQQGAQLSAAFDEKKQVELGKLAGARYIVCGSIFVREKRYDIVAVLIDIESGEEKARVRGSLPRMKDLEDIASGALADRVDENAPAEPNALGSPAAKMIARGDHLYDQRRDAAALRVYEKALQVDPTFPPVLFRLGYLHQHVRRDPKTALAYYKRYFQVAKPQEPNYHKALNNRGAIRLNAGRLREAMADFNRALAAKPDYAAALCNRALCQIRLLGAGLNDKTAKAARRDYERAMKLEPKNADIRFRIGKLEERLKRWDEAMTRFAEATALNPKHAQAWLERGRLCAQVKKDYVQAEKCFTQALQADPRYAPAWFNRAVVRGYYLRRRAEAAADAKQYLKLEPRGRFAADARKIIQAAP